MLKVAITGNIASGKSVFENYLKDIGYNVLDTDIVAHNLFEEDRVKRLVLDAFKQFDIKENNEISRLKLGKIVFENEDLRKKLEGILHPLIKEEVQNFFSQNRDKKIVFVAVPLLIEADFLNLFDKSILVYSDNEIRRNRLMLRNNLNLEDANSRLNSQIDQDKKISMVDYVIYNNNSIEDFQNKAKELLTLLLAL